MSGKARWTMTPAEARRLAERLHAGQTDRSGQPYIGHVLRVAAAVPEDLEIVALLHDVVEDTGTTLEDLHELGVSPEDLRAIDALTRRDGETYEVFIDRVAANARATAVKIADLRDNLDPSRTGGLTPRLEARYRAALERLEYEPDRQPCRDLSAFLTVSRSSFSVRHSARRAQSCRRGFERSPEASPRSSNIARASSRHSSWAIAYGSGAGLAEGSRTSLIITCPGPFSHAQQMPHQSGTASWIWQR